ncbi:MAG: TetR/AcrR family transcriptional regulator [Erythrobacter sp.]|uniref:TetR/AcrR family transcriptional regulator n=1 Tax=Erythrobacter sp. TaxID=1042 RepID=UPI0025F393A2|nr:TetR/AcrR family transcriptional regulator [Erythrobacter sp.]MCL9998598.1 TetR/AcrR family transcriptional regulator [Erythrobacter sp.]
MRPKASYHHGELRAALIEAALLALENDGMRALSLRSLARSVGVSPMAPYHHFADRSDLMVAIAVEGFRRLQTSKERALLEAGDHPARGLVAGAVNYVDFMIAHPNLHRLMHEIHSAEGAIRGDLAEAAAAPAASLLQLVERLLSTRSSTYAAQRAATSIWSLAHGVGTLTLSGQIDPSQAKAVVQAGAEALIRGWLAD